MAYYVTNNDELASVTVSWDNDYKEPFVRENTNLTTALFVKDDAEMANEFEKYANLNNPDGFVTRLDEGNSTYIAAYDKETLEKLFGDINNDGSARESLVINMAQDIAFFKKAENETLWDIYIFDEDGIPGDGDLNHLAATPDEALEPSGGVKAELGDFETMKEALQAFKSFERSDIELNPMCINGTVSTYFELENGDILEVSHADPDGEFPPENAEDKAQYDDGISYVATIYDRDKLDEELNDEFGDTSNAIVDSSNTFYSTSLHEADIDLTGNHTLCDIDRKEPVVTFGIEDAVENFDNQKLPTLADEIRAANEKSSEQVSVESPSKNKDDMEI